MSEVTDRIGQTVSVGDWIAYGVGRGDLSTALVIEILDKGTTKTWIRHVPSGEWEYQEVHNYKLRIKSPDNENVSYIETFRRHFVKIPAQPEGSEMGRSA